MIDFGAGRGEVKRRPGTAFERHAATSEAALKLARPNARSVATGR